MKQRVEVRLIVKKDDRVLLLKRSSGREELIGKFELPGGRLQENEQPEQAATRTLGEATSLEVNTMYLSDVFTYTDPSRQNIQRTVIVYIVSASGNRGDIELPPQYSRYTWDRISEVQIEDITELSSIILTTQKAKPGMSAAVDGVKIRSDVNYSSKKQADAIIYSDGGSRGNPGPSAAGFVIKDAKGQLTYEGGVYLGITTNNQAEYHGVRVGLEKAKELGVKSVEFYLDSMLVVNQLNGQYVIRNRELWPIHERIKELIKEFDHVTFKHIKREQNHHADGMVNKILDEREREKRIET